MKWRAKQKIIACSFFSVLAHVISYTSRCSLLWYYSCSARHRCLSCTFVGVSLPNKYEHLEVSIVKLCVDSYYLLPVLLGIEHIHTTWYDFQVLRKFIKLELVYFSLHERGVLYEFLLITKSRAKNIVVCIFFTPNWATLLLLLLFNTNMYNHVLYFCRLLVLESGRNLVYCLFISAMTQPHMAAEVSAGHGEANRVDTRVYRKVFKSEREVYNFFYFNERWRIKNAEGGERTEKSELGRTP